MGTALSPVRRLRAAAAALLLVPLLAGCGGDDPQPRVDEPRPSPPASASVAPSPSATPEPWEVRSKAGAVAFVEHWVEVLNESVAATATSDLAAVSDRACETCNSLIALINGWERDGTTVRSNGWEVLATRIPNSQVRPPFDAAVRIQRPPEILRFADGTTESFEGSAETYSVRLRWVRGAWSVETFDQVPT